MPVLRGLRQALVMIAGSLAVGALAALVWVVATGDRFLPAFGVAVVVLAFVVGTAGGTTLSRAAADQERAYFGLGPERDAAAAEGTGLAPLGVVLFVGLPLFALGISLLDAG